MQPHQQRVVDEKRELDEKLDKLKAFIQSEKFESEVGGQERYRLIRQSEIMGEYSNILGARIAAF